MLAMRRAVEALSLAPAEVVVDGNRCPRSRFQPDAVIRGDATVRVHLRRLDPGQDRARRPSWSSCMRCVPSTGFISTREYGTPSTSTRCGASDACEFHRRTFAPVRDVIQALAV